MYKIIKQLDGKYLALCRIQDGTERYIHATRDEAIRSLIRDAKVMNGSIIDEFDIEFGEEYQKVVTDVMWLKQPKTCKTQCRCSCR